MKRISVIDRGGPVRAEDLVQGFLDEGIPIQGWVADKNGHTIYVADEGGWDELEKLATAYLFDPDRGPDIWATQSDAWLKTKNYDPANLKAGEQLYMPAEAITNAQLLSYTGAIALLPGDGAVPGHDQPRAGVPTTPQAPAPAPIKPAPNTPPAVAKVTLTKGEKIALGVGAGAVVLGIAAVLVHRASKKR